MLLFVMSNSSWHLQRQIWSPNENIKEYILPEVSVTSEEEAGLKRKDTAKQIRARVTSFSDIMISSDC